MEEYAERYSLNFWSDYVQLVLINKTETNARTEDMIYIYNIYDIKEQV